MEVMKCSNCKNDTQINANYCSYCGAHIENYMTTVLKNNLDLDYYNQKKVLMDKLLNFNMEDHFNTNYFYKWFVVPLLLKQREVIQKFYEDNIGNEFYYAPFDFVEDCDITKINYE